MMRVLVVDDYHGSVEAARTLLELLGHECRAARTGAEALAMTESFDPQLVVLDLGLPDISGYDVARAIRARNRAPRVYIAALTGWDSSDDRVKSMAAGIDEHVTKPPRIDALQEILRTAARLTDPGA